MKRAPGSSRTRAILLSLLFILSGIGTSVLVNPAAASAVPNSAALSAAAPAEAAAPLAQAQADWEFPNGNQFNQDYNPQNQINSSDVQYLGVSWLYALSDLPTRVATYSGVGGLGVDMAILIVNGTAFATTNFDETIAFNVANGDILWSYINTLTLGQSLPGSGPLSLYTHDGNEWFTTATFGSGVSGPTLWQQGDDYVVYALDALNGKLELNFTDFTGLSMVPGNSPTSVYNGIGASNILIDPTRGVLVTGHDAEIDAGNGRGFFAGWNLNANPPSLMWVTTDTPPQPNGNVPLDPSWDIQFINNASYAWDFYPGESGSANGYTTPTELRGGVLMNTNNDIVVNWKSLSQSQLNATLYNDWGQVDQSAQCLAIDGGGSTGSTGSGSGGAWLMGSGTTSGIVYIPTNNKDPSTGPCNPGPDLWSASILAINDTTGHFIWALQTTAHDVWDYGCSWWQAAGNETINGVLTPVVFKTCKDGFLFELNALTGDLIWAWVPPTTIIPRCPICWPMNPMNATQTSFDFPSAFYTYKTGAPGTGPQPSFLQYPSEEAGFEGEQAFVQSTNTIFATSHITPIFMTYIGLNSSTYFTSTGETGTPVNTGTCAGCAVTNNNATVWSINAATGAINWRYLIPEQGYRGETDVTGDLVVLSLSSGDILMINAQTGKLARDLYLGAPMDVGTTVGASFFGKEYFLTPVGTCSLVAVVTCPGTKPGDVTALTLLSVPPSGSNTTVTSTSTSTTTVSVSTSISTTTSTTILVTTSAGVSSTALYGVAAVAVVFVIAAGYLAMRGRKPAS